MKRFIIGACALALTVGAALAQTAPAPQTGRDVRDACRMQAMAEGVRGSSRRAFVNECFAKARPDLANAQACRQIGKSRGLTGRDLNAYVKSCKIAA